MVRASGQIFIKAIKFYCAILKEIAKALGQAQPSQVAWVPRLTFGQNWENADQGGGPRWLGGKERENGAEKPESRVGWDQKKKNWVGGRYPLGR